MATVGKDVLVAPPSQITCDQILSEYPFHWFVWNKDASSIEEELALARNDKEKTDTRGRTAIHLAVSLGYVDCVKALLHGGCDANAINKDGWNVLQEAISTGNPEITSLVLQHRDFQRGNQRLAGIPELLEDLKAAPDFYVEMKWEFTSWVPFMSRMCPSDTYKIYKSGAAVRVDTTLLGFDQNDWQRGNRTYVFKGEENGGVFLEIDHDRGRVWKETLSIRDDVRDVSSTKVSEDVLNQRMSAPIVTTYLDTDNIAFTRHKTMWGWGGDKTETIDNLECKVYTGSGVEVVTKTRVEHLAEDDKKNVETFPVPQGIAGSGLHTLLGIEDETTNPLEDEDKQDLVDPTSTNPYRMTVEEYFNPSLSKQGRDIGRLKEMSTKRQKFRATISMADPHPLSLQQQVLPIIKLLAISNAHFAKLRDFIALHLPAGFPVKIEIPLFHVLNAKITFGNIDSRDKTVTGVHCLYVPPDAASNEGGKEEEGETASRPVIQSCTIDSQCFEAPSGYRLLRAGEHPVPVRDEEDELLQLAIQQSLLEYSNVSPGDKAAVKSLVDNEDEDKMLQRAIRESMKECGIAEGPSNTPPSENNQENDDNNAEDQLKLVMALSQQQLAEDERRRRQEEEELQRVLELSMTEK
ncbi:ankyrin repeat domain-containing protein 13D-like [Actinia tenebrosa]|uniref:Ankyrin repeat domain-containing protein 13D-like n=1 Tax=Actinia tenebrosa TaxID=6105 RepID=A0A6P8IB23_ACTTE|nr:ankyrin repeat domain-containing protein 13D-like [Actinia tenebrosa]